MTINTYTFCYETTFYRKSKGWIESKITREYKTVIESDNFTDAYYGFLHRRKYKSPAILKQVILNTSDNIQIQLYHKFSGFSNYDNSVFEYIDGYKHLLPLDNVFVMLKLNMAYAVKHITEIMTFFEIYDPQGHLIGTCYNINFKKNIQYCYYPNRNLLVLNSDLL